MTTPLLPADAQTLSSAFGCVQRGDATSGLTLITPLVARYRQHPDVQYVHGLLLRDSGQLEPAAAAMALAVAAAPSRSDLMLGHGNVLARLGRIDDAVAVFDRAIAAAPGHVEGWLNKGLTLHDDGQYAAAIATFDAGLARVRNDPRLLAARGVALQAMDRFDEAIASLRQAAAADPRRALTRFNLAVTLRGSGRFADACSEYEQAYALGLRTPDLAVAWAAAALEAGDVERARTLYSQVIAHVPDHAEAQAALVRLRWEYDAAGAAAFDDWTAAVSTRPVLSSATALVKALANYGLDDRAGEMAHAAMKTLGRDPALLMGWASATAKHDPATATAAFAEIATALPDVAGVRVSFAHHLLRLGDVERAAQEATRATQIDPANQAGWAYLGTAWQALGDARADWLFDCDRFVAPIMLRSPRSGERHDAFIQRVAAAALRHHQTRHHPGGQSLRTGSQTSGNIFRRNDPDLADLEAALREAVGGFIAALPDDPGHPFLSRRANAFRFSGAWSARLFPGGFHVSHIHPEGWISSASYWLVPTAVDDPAQPRAGWIEFGRPPPELGLTSAARRSVRPEPGLLVLFPSYLWHGTVPFAGAEPRLTVAFDVVPSR